MKEELKDFLESFDLDANDYEEENVTETIDDFVEEINELKKIIQMKRTNNKIIL